MSNNSIKERFNNILNKGADRWLSRSLFEEDDHVAKAVADAQQHLQQQTERQPQSKPSRPNLDLSRNNNTELKTDAHSSGNRDKVFAQESLSLRAMKNHLIDKQDIDSNDYFTQLQGEYGNHATKANVDSARTHAKTAEKLFRSRLDDSQLEELLPNLRLGRQDRNNSDLGDIASVRYGEKINSIFKSLGADKQKEVFGSTDINSWNPQDGYGIDGRIEDKLLSEMEEARVRFATDPSSMIHAINNISRNYIGNNQLFPMSLKAVPDGGEGQFSDQNIKEIKDSEDAVRAASMSQLRPINMNLNLTGDSTARNESAGVDFDSNSLDFLVKMAIESQYSDDTTGSDDYYFNYRTQRGAQLNPNQADVSKMYRNEPMPLRRAEPSYGEFTLGNKPKEPNLKLLTLPETRPTSPVAGRKYDEKVAENEKRQKTHDEAMKEYEKKLKAFEDGREEAEKMENRGYSADNDSKSGMIPADILRENISELTGQQDQNYMMGTEAPSIQDPGEYNGPMNRNGTPKKSSSEYQAWAKQKKAFDEGEKESPKFRDFTTEGDNNELDYWTTMLQGLYDYQDESGGFNINTDSDLTLGNQTYGKDQLRDYLSDLFAIDKEARLPAEQRETTERLFGKSNMRFTSSLQQKTRLLLERIAMTSGFKDHHIKGDLKDIIAKGFLKGSKAKDNLNHPYFKLEKERIMEMVENYWHAMSFVLQYS